MRRRRGVSVRIIVAGFGNVLRSDDAFGVAVAQTLSVAPPSEVEVMDVGIGGIHLVQQLLDGADGLVVVDAVEVGRPAGTVVVIEPVVEDVADLSVMERRDRLADMHYATPDRAMMLAMAMGVLPSRTVVVGCQPVDADTPDRQMSDVVAKAVPVAADEVRAIVTSWGVPWAGDGDDET